MSDFPQKRPNVRARQASGPLPPAAVLVAVLVLVGVSGGAQATPTFPVPDVYVIKGYVRDPLLRGVGGAAVAANRIECNPATDPDQCLARQRLTDATGYYEIGENATGRFLLVVSKPGTTGASREITVLLPADQTEDFSVSYLVTGAPERPYLSTAQGPASTTLVMTSWAPLPRTDGDPSPPAGSSCVKAKDLRTNTTQAASYSGPAQGGGYRWTSPLSLPQGTPQGSYGIEMWAEDCANPATHLSTTGTTSYLVDNTPPLFDVIAPVNGGNTIYDAQPIVARGKDVSASDVPYAPTTYSLGSGVDPASLEVRVDGQLIPSSMSGGIVRSDPASVSRGARHSAVVAGRDRAGNEASTTVQFLVMKSASVGAPKFTTAAPIAWTEKQEGGLTSLNDTYVWRSAPVDIGSFAVSLDGSDHVGDGKAVVRTDVATAVVSYRLAGVLQTAHPEPGIFPYDFAFSVSATGASTIAVAGRAETLPEVRALIPKAATDVTLSMDADAVNTGFSVCPDPTVGTTPCLPDPVATFGDREDLWRPWADLLDADPMSVPEGVAAIEGLSLPAPRCSSGAPTLGESIERWGAAVGEPDSLNPDMTLDAAASAAIARIVDCMATYVPLVSPGGVGPDQIPSDSQRSEWLAAFRDLLLTLTPPTLDLPPGTGCVDSNCRIQTGGQFDDRFVTDAALVLDAGGADTYENNAGGTTASPFIPIAIVLDRGNGDDHYYPAVSDGFASSPRPTIAAGVLGVGMILDEGGFDHYCGLGLSMGAGRFGGGMLLDRGDGWDRYESFHPTGGSTLCPNQQAGSSYGYSPGYDIASALRGGFGFVIDEGGDDVHIQHGEGAMGYGLDLGTGLLVDRSGNDSYEDFVGPVCGISSCSAPACYPQFCVDVTLDAMGVGEGRGWGVLLDGAGADTYRCSASLAYGCIGASQNNSFGLVYDRGVGNDSYSVPSRHPDFLGRDEFQFPIYASGLASSSTQTSTEPIENLSNPPAIALLVDVIGDTSNPNPNNSYSSATFYAGGVSAGSEAVFLDIGGRDSYTFARGPFYALDQNAQPIDARQDYAFWVGEEAYPNPDYEGGYGVDRCC